jgi:hypothetical protein
MTRQSDKHRSERSFTVGDWVFLKLQPYAQASIARRPSQKLAFRFFGPYKVEAKIRNVAYRLALPSSSQIHPVFHVSQLKKSHGNEPVSSELPSTDAQFQVPEAILQRWWTSGDHPIEQVLIKWSLMPPTLATWEPYAQLRQQFPRAPAWGHAGSQEGGNVSTIHPTTTALRSPSLLTKEAQMCRPAREKKPNSFVADPDWL